MIRAETAAPATPLALALLLALAALPLLHTLADPFGRDQGIYAAIALAMAEGAVPYRDLFELKPPGALLPFLGAELVAGPAEWGPRAVDLAAVLATALLLAAIARRLGFGPGAPAVAFLYAALHGSASFWHRAQPDPWATLPAAAALLLLLPRGGGAAGPARWAAAGALWGLAFLLKYPAAALALAALPLLPGPRLVPRLAAAAAGGLAVLAAAAATLAAAGALGPFLAIQAFLSGYLGIAPSLLQRLEGPATMLLHAPLATLLALAGAALPGRQAGPPVRAILLLWLAGAVAAGAVQDKGFIYHYLGMAAPLALLGGRATDRLLGSLSAARAALVLAALLALAGALSLAGQRSVLLLRDLAAGDLGAATERRAVTPDFSLAEVRAAAARLRAAAPGGTLFVWGYDAMLYPLTGTAPRHRYVTSWPFLAAHDDGRFDADLLARLAADPPDLVAIQSGDGSRIGAGTPRDSATRLAQKPALARLLAEGWCPLAELPGFTLLARRGGPACPPS